MRCARGTQREGFPALCTPDVNSTRPASSIYARTGRDLLWKHNACRGSTSGILHSHYERFRSFYLGLCPAADLSLSLPPSFPSLYFAPFSSPVFLIIRVSHGGIVNRETGLTSGGQRVVKRSWRTPRHGQTRARPRACARRSPIGRGDYNCARRGWNPSCTYLHTPNRGFQRDPPPLWRDTFELVGFRNSLLPICSLEIVTTIVFATIFTQRPVTSMISNLRESRYIRGASKNTRIFFSTTDTPAPIYGKMLLIISTRHMGHHYCSRLNCFFFYEYLIISTRWKLSFTMEIFSAEF